MRHQCSVADILDAWTARQVPAIAVYRPDWRKRPALTHWVRRTDHSSYWDLTNPQQQTAYHACVVLPTMHADVRAAYCLYAFALETLGLGRGGRLHDFQRDVIMPIFSDHRENLYGWWDSNARLVLPPLMKYQDRDYSWFVRADTPDDLEILEAAADYWTRAAAESMAVFHPEWEPPQAPRKPVFGEPQ